MRALDKIEKELGYCEVKLERERRLRCQELYLRADLEALEEVFGVCGWDGGEALKAATIAGVRIADVPQLLRHGPKTKVQRVRRAFVMLAAQVCLKDMRELLANELVAVVDRLSSYNDFEGRRSDLARQRRSMLARMGVGEGSLDGRVVREFRCTEATWNRVSEDFSNAENALYHLEHNLDYLAAARGFMLGARAVFDIGDWCAHGCFSDLFRHSPVGRAYEMVGGADLNVRLAEKELICLKGWNLHSRPCVTVMAPFVQALFEDIFVRGSFHGAKRVLDEAQQKNRLQFERLAVLRESLGDEKLSLEDERDVKYHLMGVEVKKAVCN